MSAPKRKRSPRKTPPGVKPLPRKVTDQAIMDERLNIIERGEELERREQLLAADSVYLQEDKRKYREKIEKRYHMTPNDTIEPDGTITRETQ